MIMKKQMMVQLSVVVYHICVIFLAYVINSYCSSLKHATDLYMWLVHLCVQSSVPVAD